jgi:hypothetical protein
MSIDSKSAGLIPGLQCPDHHEVSAISCAGVGFVKAVRNDWKDHVRKGLEAQQYSC